MTKDQANELKVGIVVLVCLGLGLGVALALSNWEQWLEPKNTLTFKVPYQAGIGGIKGGWPVTIGGVEVGSVEKIWSVREPIDAEDIEEEDTEEKVSSKAEGSQVTGEHEAQKPQQESEAAKETTTTYSYFRFTVPSKYELYEDCELTPASQLIGGAGELLISDFGSKGKLLQDGDEVFRKDLGKSSMAAVMDRAQQVITKAQEAMDRIGKITEDFKHVSGNAREMVSVIKPQLEKTMANVRAASEEMKQAMREIRWNPWRLLHNPSKRELRTQNILTATRAYSSGASDVYAAIGKIEGLFDARGDDMSSDDPDLIQAIEELKASMAKFKQAEDALLKRLGK
ncbi:MAG: hypothetical protein KAT11_04860 [Phycisphaerae bacterium]|nr:hypothetical protein [Phycisphaerae bacterium]